MSIQDVAKKTSLERWTTETSGKRGSGGSMLAAGHDDDDDDDFKMFLILYSRLLKQCLNIIELINLKTAKSL